MLVISPDQFAALEETTAERRVASGAARIAAMGAPHAADVLHRTWAECAKVADALGWTDDRHVDRLVRLTLTPSARSPDLVTAAVHAALIGSAKAEAALATLERQIL